MNRNIVCFLMLGVSLLSSSLFAQETEVTSTKESKKVRQEKEVKEVVPDSVFGHFLLVNTANPKKTFKLKDSGGYTLIYNETVQDTITAEKVHFAYGNIRDMNDEKVAFDVRNESIEHIFKDGSVANSQIDFSSYYFSNYEQPREINLSSLRYVEYSSPGRTVLHATGLSFMILGGATMIAAAPLLNINFKSGNINQKGYFNTLKLGAIAFAVGFPINYLTPMKQYAIGNKTFSSDKDLWYLDKEK